MLPSTLDRDKVIIHLQSKGAISFWFYCMPYSFFVRSNHTARQLQDLITPSFKADNIIIIHIARGVDISGLVPENQANLFTNL